MKKFVPHTLALALGAALVLPASAAVNVFGVLDMGMSVTDVQGGDRTVEMTSSNYAGSRIGFKGTEELGNGMTVGFHMESGFSGDTGALGGGKLFSREAHLYVENDFGRFGMGRIASFASASGSMNWWWDFDAFDAAYTDAGTQATQVGLWGFRSNSLYFASKPIAGVKFAAQYSLTDKADAEATHFSDNNRYANLIARYDGSNFAIAASFERFLRSDATATGAVSKDGNYFKIGANMDFGVAKLYTGYAYGQDMNSFGDSVYDEAVNKVTSNNGKGLKSHAAHVGVRVPMGTGYAMAQYQIVDGENKGAADADYKRQALSLGYHCTFAPSTMGYVVTSYATGEGLLDNGSDNRTRLDVGMVHYF